MKLKHLGFIVILIFSTQSIFAQENVDIDSLIKEISINNQKDAFSNYSYKMQFVRQKKTLFGQDKLVKRFDVVLPSKMPKNRTYNHRLLLVYDNKKPLTQSDILNSRKNIIEDLEKYESESSEESSKQQVRQNKTGGYLTLRAETDKSKQRSVGINILKLIKGSAFSNFKELKKDGRDTISLDFRPKPDTQFNGDFFYLNKVEGIMFIDKADKRIVEVEAFPLDKLNEFRKRIGEEREDSRVFYYLQTRVPDGFWFPRSVTVNFMKFPEQFDGLEVKINFQFTEYRRFTTSVDNYNPRAVRRKADQPRKNDKLKRERNN